MCGICGWISYTSKKEDNISVNDTNCLATHARLEVMKILNDTLLLRGPDDQNIWVSEDELCIFGHTRLIVIDPEGGKQPMSTSDESNRAYTITYNGELYNTEDIRAELIIKGHVFRGYSDTEVLLHSYMEWNLDCISRLNGIFAFAIWSNGKLFFARDRIGVKPFFYSTFPGNFIFGSEIKTLLAHPMVSRDVVFDSLNTIFALATIRPAGFVPFKDIQELRAGFAGTFSEDEGLNTWRYWDVSGNLTEDSVEEAAAKVHNFLKDATLRQTVSDVPIGTLLSGGIDSTAIMHFLCEKNNSEDNFQDPLAFSVGLPDYSEYFEPTGVRINNDEEFIRFACSKYKLNHRWIPESSSDIISAVEISTIAKDYPIISDMDPTAYLLCKGIKPYATVLLSGEGADELFGGYKHLYIDSVFPGIPSSTALSYQPLLRDELQEKFRLRDREIQIYNDCIKDCPSPISTTEVSSEEIEFRRRIYSQLKIILPFMLERKDRMSMASGVEVRVPITDHRLIDYAFQIPKSYKMYQDVEKYIFRRSMVIEETFPEEIRERRKVPYPALVDPESLKLSREMFATLLVDPEREPIFRWFDVSKVKKEFEDGFENFKRSYFHPELMATMNLYSLNFWFKHYRVNVVNE